MYSKSSSDYTALKHYQEKKNIFYSRDSGNKTQVLKINTVLLACNTDEYGNILPSTWFNIQINPEYTDCRKSTIEDLTNMTPDQYKPATIVDLTNTTPLMINPPEMSTEQYKSEIKPCSSYNEFRQNLKLCKRHYKKFPTMSFT